MVTAHSAVISPFFCVTMTMKVHMITYCGLHTWASCVPLKDGPYYLFMKSAREVVSDSKIHSSVTNHFSDYTHFLRVF